MSTVAEALANAVRLHQAGELQRAEAIYRQILQADPAHADALHCLGVVAYQVGNLSSAIELMRQSVTLAPFNDGFHCNLGLAYQAAGRLDEAIASFQQSVHLRPESAQAHNNLGNALANQGKLEDAAACYLQSMRLQPEAADACNNLAVVRQKQGRLAEAVDLFWSALRLNPDSADTRHNLATAFLVLGKTAEAVEQFQKALELRPDYAEAHSSMATALQRLGLHEDAESHARQALLLRPGLGAIHNNLGSIYQQQGKLDQARHCFQEALKRDPNHPDVLLNLGMVLRAQGHVEEAIKRLHQAVELQPKLVEGHVQLAIALQDQGEIAKAIGAFGKALTLQPDHADAGNRLGVLLGKQGRLEESAHYFRQTLHFHPHHFEAHNNLGNTLNKLGQTEEALACFHQALRYNPDCAEVYHNMGTLVADQGNLEEAAGYFEQALRLQPDKADSHASLGDLLHIQGQADKAVASLQEALRLRPSNPLRIALATCLPVVFQSQQELEHWRRRLTHEIRRLREQNVVMDLTDEQAKPLFYLAYHGFGDRDIQREVAQLYHAPTMPRAKPQATVSGKIRVGFLSAFFRRHTIGHWMRGLVEKLSRNDFSVTVLSVGKHDDDIANLFKRHADAYLEVPRHLGAARQLIADQKLDVLFYTDIGMDPMTYTLAFSRLAPVQCVTLGHPITTGIDTIDYFISTGALESAEADQHYTETLVRLKTLPIYYYRPPLPLTPTSSPPAGKGAAVRGRAHYGLAPQDHVYACLQTIYKFHPEFDKYLGAILRGDPRGTLILSQGRFPHLERLLRQRLAVSLPDVLDRIRFYPLLDYSDYLNLLAVADVQLDPMPFGGGSTSYDGMAVGTPIVTLPSNLLRGRITYALYHQMNVLDCVAKSPQDYIAMALRLGGDREYREAIRSKILAANGVLFENSAGIRELEQFFRQAVAAVAPE
ncbi:MAG TPA: tetratricopeptide repeat protein [Gemmataceae bacterium]|nr:tetratricopeptide repeat protein [Gemmataceae bacterium]